VVLGTALAIKMIAYVGVAPVLGGFANLLPRRAFLVSMDLTRAAVAVALPFLNRVSSCCCRPRPLAFTPTFQATIPDGLPDLNDYTRALSLSRLALRRRLRSGRCASGTASIRGGAARREANHKQRGAPRDEKSSGQNFQRSARSAARDGLLSSVTSN
jgi:hypothetical protein